MLGKTAQRQALLTAQNGTSLSLSLSLSFSLFLSLSRTGDPKCPSFASRCECNKYYYYYSTRHLTLASDAFVGACVRVRLVVNVSRTHAHCIHMSMHMGACMFHDDYGCATWTKPELSAGPPGTKLLQTREPEGSVPNTMPHPHSSCHSVGRLVSTAMERCCAESQCTSGNLSLL